MTKALVKGNPLWGYRPAKAMVDMKVNALIYMLPEPIEGMVWHLSLFKAVYDLLRKEDNDNLIPVMSISG